MTRDELRPSVMLRTTAMSALMWADLPQTIAIIDEANSYDCYLAPALIPLHFVWRAVAWSHRELFVGISTTNKGISNAFPCQSRRH